MEKIRIGEQEFDDEESAAIYKELQQIMNSVRLPDGSYERLMRTLEQASAFPEDPALTREEEQAFQGNRSDEQEGTRWTPLLSFLVISTKRDYRSCRNCSYNVTSDEEFCPNCGIFSPYEEPSDGLSEKARSFAKTTTKSGFFIGYGIVAFFVFAALGSGLENSKVPPSVVSNIGILYLVVVVSIAIIFRRIGKKLIYKSEKFKERYKKHSESHLLKYEQMIKDRLQRVDIQERRGREEVKETSLERRKEIILSGLERLSSLRRQYQEKLYEIELIRWHNKSKMAYENAFGLEESEYDARIQQSKQAIKEGKELLNQWNENGYSNLPAIQRLSDALDTCENLENELYELQFRAAEGQVQYIEAAFTSEIDTTGIDNFDMLGDRSIFETEVKELFERQASQ